MKKVALAAGIILGLAFVGVVRASTPISNSDAEHFFYKSHDPINTVKGCRVTVTTSATVMTCGLSGARVRVVKNCDSASIDVGDSAVTATTGYTLAANETLAFNPAYDTLSGVGLSAYGIAASATVTVCVLEAN